MRAGILFTTLLLFGTLRAQGSFRIFDSQMNDVTNGIIYLADTNASQMQLNLTVENIDSVSHNVTAGRLFISQPAGSTDAFTWGQIQYLPNTDSSVAPEIIAPAGTQDFEAYYFPNGGGTATVNYCFWERTDMNINSCVTVTFDNLLNGIPWESGTAVFSYGPNPAPYVIGVGWSGWEYTIVNLYSSDGKLIESRDVRGKSECGFHVAELPAGIYMISCMDAQGKTFNSRFVH